MVMVFLLAYMFMVFCENVQTGLMQPYKHTHCKGKRLTEVGEEKLISPTLYKMEVWDTWPSLDIVLYTELDLLAYIRKHFNNHIVALQRE